jgi:putative GTP pyrophosphokinase
MLSNTQIDRLGDRLRAGSPTDSDLTTLDEFRRSFGEAYGSVIQSIERIGLEPTGRPAKSTGSIIEKLHRESIRLTQVQDIAGCRVVVPDRQKQDAIVAALRGAFPGAAVIDRRQTPSFGFRAVHVVPKVGGRAVEIQVRSAPQHLWAELSEKLSDVVDKNVKYGGGPERLQEALISASNTIARFEELEAKLALIYAAVSEVDAEVSRISASIDKADVDAVEQYEKVREQRAELERSFKEVRRDTSKAKGTIKEFLDMIYLLGQQEVSKKP